MSLQVDEAENLIEGWHGLQSLKPDGYGLEWNQDRKG